MIDKLITALSQEIQMSAEEIADTIWLALQIQEFPSESISSSLPLKTNDESEINKQQSQPNEGILPKQNPKTPESQVTPNKSPKEPKAGIYPRNRQQTSKSANLSFKVPDAPSLGEPLILARALKPLMRRIPSGRELVLDEAATIQRIADEGLWIPELRPTVEPWLDLELVVDEAISMQIWRHTIREWERLLKNYGIFRDVRVWGIITAENGQVQIRRGIGTTAKNQTPRSPKELIDPSGRRLVLVVTDCVSSFWRNGEFTPVLELWAKQGLMAIVQMLPKWLWKRTALGRASEVRLRGLTPGFPNQKLIAKEVSLWDELDEERGVKVPVFTLEPDKVFNWAQMVSGKGSIWTLGYVFKLDVNPVNKESGLFNLNYNELSAEQRVQAFRVTASPMARKLAGLLASAPVISLPIVRLIRQALLKDAQQVHVAEVFLGGLLKPLCEINADTNPDYVQYEFIDGVRELLVDSVPANYVLSVVDEVSKYVAKKAGLSLEDFAAVLKNPQQIRDSEIVEEIGYFATVTAQVLRRLGGNYLNIAEELESYILPPSQRNVKINLDYLPNFEYQIGGCLPPDSPSYINRKADEELYKAIKAGQLCIVSTPRQMGKSSLRVRTLKRLQEEGFVCASIDLSMFWSSNLTEEQFYINFIYHLTDVFELDFEISNFLELNKKISPTTLFKRFIEVLLKQIYKNIVIFIDEIDCILNLPFREGLFLLLRALSENKVQNNDYNRLNFVILGVLIDSELRQNINASPLTNIGLHIKLEGLTYQEALPLASGLAEKTNNPQELLKQILQWTGGQPFLTQKLCLLVKESEEYIVDTNKENWLNNLVRNKIIENWEAQDNPEHLKTIRSRILNTRPFELLSLYRLVLKESEYLPFGREEIQELMLTGLVIIHNNKLKVANQIYAEIFNNEWIEYNLARLSQIDYTELRNLLREKKWRDADQETFRLMLKATNREKEGTLDYQVINKVPCIDLNTIDNLWINASQGRFGFSIQLKKWQEAGGKADKETEYKLGNEIGWYVNNKWLSDIGQFTFNLSAPVGHLPVEWTFHLGGIFPRREQSVLFSDLATRLLSCNINNLEEYIKQILERITKGQETDEDIITLRQLLHTGDRQLSTQLRKYNVNIGDGKEIHISDRIYQQWDEQALQALLKAIQQATPKNVPTQFQPLIAGITKGFVGREYVFDAINAFIANNPKGYFTIVGDPGQGKSAILAKYVKNTDCIAHFNSLPEGLNRADQFLESVCRQLIERYELSYNPSPMNTTRDGEFLGQLLDEVAQKRDGEAVIIAVDSLDEVDTASYRDAANILYLPAYLPDGVYFILTRRRDVEVPLTSFAPMQTLNLLDYQADGERDVRTYIGNRVNSSDNLRQQIDVWGETITEFTNKIVEKSENNFMYLRYVLLDIESGLYQDSTLEQFPQGLQGYYEFHWRRMGMTAVPLPVEKIKIAYILGEVREPVSRRKICDLSGENEYTVQQVLNEWKQFLHELMKEEKRYSVYHSSFRDFLHRQDILDKHPVTLPGIHQLIAENELKVWQKLKGVLKNRKDE